MSTITFYLTYARKTNRHNWQCYGHDMSEQRAKYLLTIGTMAKLQSNGWQVAIVPFVAEQSGSYDRFPDNVKQLPAQEANQ